MTNREKMLSAINDEYLENMFCSYIRNGKPCDYACPIKDACDEDFHSSSDGSVFKKAFKEWLDKEAE